MRNFKMALVLLSVMSLATIAGCSDNKSGEVKSDTALPGAAQAKPGVAAQGDGAAPAGEKQVAKPSNE